MAEAEIKWFTEANSTAKIDRHLNKRLINSHNI
jgi:hypothetical protein